MDCSRSESGYVGIKKQDGIDVWLGPRCGGKYGKSLLETYCKWVEENTSEHAEIKESRKLYHKIYVIEVT